MLDSLNDQPVGKYRIRVEYHGTTRFFDQRDFSLYLLDSHADKSTTPIFRGLYNAGRPSTYVPAWIDGEFIEHISLRGKPIDLQSSFNRHSERSEESHKELGETLAMAPSDASKLAEEIAQKLGTLIPPGGRFWLAYEAFDGEGEMMRETRAGILAKVPLVTTLIGFLLFRADCWLGMRDWLFPEGGREGPRKLQGNKAVDSAHARERAGENVKELEIFLNQRAGNEIIDRAQARARLVLPAMQRITANS